jgi:tRNA pseudouridine32 synthase/23S rRNA pseudouridine746 synthase
MTPVELHKTAVYKNVSALELLANSEELSPAQILQCFDNGAVWLETTGKPRRLYQSDKILQQGDKLHLYCNVATLAACPFQPELVADFEQFSIWNKPSGMLSQGSKWGDHWALYRWIKQHHWPERASYITHRLDRYTSGLMIVAHDDAINKAFHQCFEQRKIRKTYRAIVRGAMQTGKTRTIDSAIDNKPAQSEFAVLDTDTDKHLSLLEIHPETGRKHQIRIHLAGIDHPVLNDRNYGTPPHDGDLSLQASALAFTSPVDEQKINVELKPFQLLALRAK